MPGVHFDTDVLLVSGKEGDCTVWSDEPYTEKGVTLKAFGSLGSEDVVKWVKTLRVRAQYPSDDMSDSDSDDDMIDDDVDPPPPIPTEGLLRENITGEDLLNSDEFSIDYLLERCDVADARHQYAISRSLEHMRESADDDGGMWESVAQIELFKSKHGLGKAKLHIDPVLDKVFQEVQSEIQKVFVDVREHSTWRSASIINAFERVISLAENCIRENNLKPKQEQVIIDAAQGVRHRLDELGLIEDCIPEPGEQLEEDEIENLLQEVVEVVTEANDLFLLVNLVGCMKVMATPRYDEVFDSFDKATSLLGQFRDQDADTDAAGLDQAVVVETVYARISKYQDELRNVHPYVMVFPSHTADVLSSSLSLLRNFQKEVSASGETTREDILKTLDSLAGYIRHMLVCERGQATVVDAETVDDSVKSIQALLEELKERLSKIFGENPGGGTETITANPSKKDVIRTQDKKDKSSISGDSIPECMSPADRAVVSLSPSVATERVGVHGKRENGVQPESTEEEISVAKYKSAARKAKLPVLPPAVPIEVAVTAASTSDSNSGVTIGTHSGTAEAIKTTEEVTELETAINQATAKLRITERDLDEATVQQRRPSPPKQPSEISDLADGPVTESTRLLSSPDFDNDGTGENSCWRHFLAICFGHPN